LASILDTMADMLEVLGENRFKVRAYRKAARNIMDLVEDIEDVAERGDLTNIPGVGKEIARKIEQFLREGTITEYERLKRQVPLSMELLDIQGLGPKTLALLYKELGVRTLDDLERALESGQVEKLPRMGRKKVEELKKGVAFYKLGAGRIPLGEALPIAEEVTEALGALEGVIEARVAGSLRRMKETIGDIDILAMAEDGGGVIERFTKLPFVDEVLLAGETKCSVRVKGTLQLDVRVVRPESWGAALQYFTGSQAHNVHMRTIAIKHGLVLNEYGLFRDGRRLAGRTEEEIYEKLGMEWIPPELREDRGEIEAAIEGTLPRLVRIEEIRGDLHVHSDWSDGRDSIEQMVEAARRVGYDYVAIADHSPSSTVAGGLSRERLKEKRKALERVRAEAVGIAVLMAAEVDIRSDGSLDYPDEVLAGLDLVVAAVHSGFKSDSETMTRRMVKALENPYVDVLAHPTGRLLGSRAAYEFDVETVMKTALRKDKALEINSHYLRLDLNDVNARTAVGMGVKLVISTDAHSTEQLRMMRYGVATARRGWVEARHVVNCWDRDRLMGWLASRKRGRG